MTDSQSRLDQMLVKLKDLKFRITPQRLAVLKILAESKEHPSVDRIYEQVRADFPTTSLATVYKTITLLKELNEVLELGFSEGSNRYDGYNPYPHPHVICTQCREIIDPELTGIRRLTEEAKGKTGYRITTHRLDFFGLCKKCQMKTSEKPRLSR